MRCGDAAARRDFPGIMDLSLNLLPECVPGVCWALSEAEEGVLSKLQVFIVVSMQNVVVLRWFWKCDFPWRR